MSNIVKKYSVGGQSPKRKVLFLMLLFVASCSRTPEAITPDHVFLIGLDAWGSYSVEQADMPVIKELMKNGAWTLKTRSVLPSSSACNWASAIMGAGPELHGYTTWGSKTPDLPSRVLNEYGMFPTIFSLIREKYPEAELGAIFEWDGIGYLFEKEIVNYISQIEEPLVYPERTAQDAVKYIKEKKPKFTWIVFDEPDVVGHRDGHNTPQYYEKLTELDGYVGEIIEATKEAGIYDNSLFIIMADHGGIERTHGGKTMQEMEVPLIFFGKGVKQGHEITKSTMIYDIASTIAHIFDIEQPQVWIGRPVI